jgi:hypothetical protein
VPRPGPRRTFTILVQADYGVPPGATENLPISVGKGATYTHADCNPSPVSTPAIPQFSVPLHKSDISLTPAPESN